MKIRPGQYKVPFSLRLRELLIVTTPALVVTTVFEVALVLTATALVSSVPSVAVFLGVLALSIPPTAFASWATSVYVSRVVSYKTKQGLTISFHDPLYFVPKKVAEEQIQNWMEPWRKYCAQTGHDINEVVKGIRLVATPKHPLRARSDGRLSYVYSNTYKRMGNSLVYAPKLFEREVGRYEFNQHVSWRIFLELPDELDYKIMKKHGVI